MMRESERIRAELACRRLVMVYASYIDLRRYDAVIELFCEDAVFRPRDTEYHGREGVRTYLESRPETRRSRHLITNHIVDFDSPAQAAGFCNLLYFADEDAPENGRPAPLTPPRLIGDYHDIYRKTEQGWRFASRIGKIIFEA